nr:LysM peptidoglycan-binding domain-containing M23 family metallopeptidase [Rhodovibrio salinarum]
MCRSRRALPLILAVVCVLGVSSCTRSGPPAPVVYGSGGPGQNESAGRASSGNTSQSGRQSSRQRSRQTIDRSGRSSAPRETRQRDTGSRQASQAQSRRTSNDVNWVPTGRAGIHTVRKGDTVYGLARRYQVPIRAIIDANDLQPPYTLFVGQEVRIPVPRRHVVERGDTVYGISRAYGVDMSELTRLNDIQPPYQIAPGEVLVIPGPGRETSPTRTVDSQESGSQTANTRTSEEAEPARKAPRTQTSEQPSSAPETRTSASSADTRALASLPDAPAGTPRPPTPPEAKTAGAWQTRTADASSPPSSSAPSSASQQSSTQRASAPQPKSIPQPPPRAQSRFLWPVRGRVLSKFGPMDGGLHNDGINIAAPAGTPVKAAENGVVAYVGNELRGFGNLLLIKHADGWVTAYAHTQEILVRHGQRVRRGQAVARVGATGAVSQPQLHFEVRKGSKAKDPAQLLGSQQAQR